MQTLAELFASFAKFENQTAIIYRLPNQRSVFSYSEIYDHSLKLNGWLQSQGIKKGDRIVLALPNSPLWAVVFWAVISLGAVVVPLDLNYTDQHIQELVTRVAPKLLFTAKPIKNVTIPSVYASDIPGLIVTSARGILMMSKAQDLAEIIFTSGTTGAAKGICLTHGNLAANISQIQHQLPMIDNKFTFLSFLPLSQIFEQMAGFLIPLSVGGRVVYFSSQTPSLPDIFGAFEEENISCAVLVPLILRKLTQAFSGVSLNGKIEALKNKIKFQLEFFVCGGSALEVQTAKFWQDQKITVIQGYGLTECSPVIACEKPNHRLTGSVGQALQGVEIKIENGEILVRGPNVFSKYWQKDVSAQEVFTRGKWFKTGDEGEITNGFLRILGRIEDKILLLNGESVYPQALESVLNGISGVKESCVVAKKTVEGEELHAVLILDDAVSNPAQIIKQMNKQVDSKLKIKSFSCWRGIELPKTASLKIQRFRVNNYINNYFREPVLNKRNLQ